MKSRIKEKAREYAINRHSSDELWKIDRCESTTDFVAGATWMQSELKKDVDSYKNDIEESKQREVICNKVLSDKRREIEQLQELTRWRDVEEELPELHKTVLARDLGGYFFTAHVGVHGWINSERAEYLKSRTITHWLPIPEFRKEGEK